MGTNQIDKTAKIHPKVILGKYNKIGKNVEITILNDNVDCKAIFGDNNIINDNTRILISGNLNVGDWNVFHNNMLVMADNHLKIGHNGWFGQNTILDGAGGLEIGNGVRIGMYSQIWTHVASGELIEGCNLFAKRKTIIEDDVWLVGSCIVSSGLTLGKRSTALINSVITKNTEPNRAYAGSPAKLMENVNFYNPISVDDKFKMILDWVKEFVLIEKNISFIKNNSEIILENSENSEKVTFTKLQSIDYKTNNNSVFFLINKKYLKTNSELERKIYKFLYGNKARFIPLNTDSNFII
jgi:acetyltransferase-like isoleucine patch superfamily enzyme